MFAMMKKLLALGIPLAVGFVAQMMIPFTDAALVAHLGVVALSGTMLALSLFLVLLCCWGLVLLLPLYQNLQKAIKGKSQRI
ncbi:hypothetical protein [Bartonella sp. DGB1]|uniref:hypothetical protein n=1 Tax=Bartonella sp. DGB1 TaxID=3239807 RepID=UPI0035240D0E